MSFHDLTKDGTLGPEELFKYRLKRDCTIPSRGGQKEFEPDGSWMQNKRLEAFLQERKSILSEPRVEKLKNIVEGLWDEQKNLVNLKKPGKFWMHMGFTDERRNWLYPEEALFLMETNTLEVYNEDRPVSVQEAYTKFIGHGMCLEEYQVFAHLRRLGYVVLRHEEERILTDYERKINMSDYIDKKKRKEKLKKGKGKSSKKNSNNPNMSTNNSFKNNKLDNEVNSTPCAGVTNNACNNQDSDFSQGVNGGNDCSKDVNGIDVPALGSSDSFLKRSHEKETEVPDSKKLHSEDSDTVHCETGLLYDISSWSSCLKSSYLKESEVKREDINHCKQSLTQTIIDSRCDDMFPDFGQASVVGLKTPPSHLLPPNLEVCEEFVAQAENFKSPVNISDAHKRNFEDDLQEKKFSYFERVKSSQPEVNAKSWSEFKHQREKSLADTSASPFDYLWKEEITPLMRPTEVTSYKDIMDKLRIIQSADNKTLTPDVSVLPMLPRISFDVHLPDQRFKKSMPGVPDHRVCVTRHDGIPPGLTAIQYLWSKYKDNVPVHWAVVDSGEIAFYVFDNSRSLDDIHLA